ncbi:MAG: hypothetical protein V3U86_09305 [Acidobacteriota bacterium]
MTAVHLRILHAAFIAGICGFALVIAIIGPSSGIESTSILRLTWLGVAAAAMVGAGAVSGRLAAQADVTERARTAIVLWALGEGPALLGLIFYFMTGDRLLLVLPLVAFLVYMTRYRPASFAG